MPIGSPIILCCLCGFKEIDLPTWEERVRERIQRVERMIKKEMIKNTEGGKNDKERNDKEYRGWKE